MIWILIPTKGVFTRRCGGDQLLGVLYGERFLFEMSCIGGNINKGRFVHGTFCIEVVKKYVMPFFGTPTK